MQEKTASSTKTRPAVGSGKDPIERLSRDGLSVRKLISEPGMKVAEWFFDKGTDAPTHTHDDEFGITYVISGEFEAELDGKLQRFGPGDAFTIPPGLSHALRCTASGSYVLVSVRDATGPTAHDAHGHSH